MPETSPTVSPSKRQAPFSSSPSKRVAFKLDEPLMIVLPAVGFDMDYDSTDQENIIPAQRPKTRVK